MSHATDYLTWMSGRETDSASADGTPRPGPAGRASYVGAQKQGQQGAYLSAQRAAQDLLRLCLGPSATGGTQPPPTQDADTAK
jgi:hypothetical protein